MLASGNTSTSLCQTIQQRKQLRSETTLVPGLGSAYKLTGRKPAIGFAFAETVDFLSCVTRVRTISGSMWYYVTDDCLGRAWDFIWVPKLLVSRSWQTGRNYGLLCAKEKEGLTRLSCNLAVISVNILAKLCPSIRPRRERIMPERGFSQAARPSNQLKWADIVVLLMIIQNTQGLLAGNPGPPSASPSKFHLVSKPNHNWRHVQKPRRNDTFPSLRSLPLPTLQNPEPIGGMALTDARLKQPVRVWTLASLERDPQSKLWETIQMCFHFRLLTTNTYQILGYRPVRNHPRTRQQRNPKIIVLSKSMDR
ncbi:hypothetical protein B0T13DRAFT_444115 [Neurospora crassa]|nr:hypothetical protein B0T13DRAFT_444115 [Neurospora crassa]